MAETRYTRIIIQSSRPATYYSEQETAQYSHLDIAAIRELQAEGLIHGVEVVGEEMRYSDEDVAMLRRIRRLQRQADVHQQERIRVPVVDQRDRVGRHPDHNHRGLGDQELPAAQASVDRIGSPLCESALPLVPTFLLELQLALDA